MAKELTVEDLNKKILDLETQNKKLAAQLAALTRALHKMETAMHELTISTKSDINTLRSKLRS